MFFLNRCSAAGKNNIIRVRELDNNRGPQKKRETKYSPIQKNTVVYLFLQSEHTEMIHCETSTRSMCVMVLLTYSSFSIWINRCLEGILKKTYCPNKLNIIHPHKMSALCQNTHIILSVFFHKNPTHILSSLPISLCV